MSEKIFIEGMSMKEVAIPKAPWIKARIGIKMDKFMEFARQHTDERGWLNMTLAESKKGDLYIELDTFKPNRDKENKEWKPMPQTQAQIDEVKNMPKVKYPEEEPEDSPF